MREFGWNRETCLQLDADAFQLWGSWTSILDAGVFREGDKAPYVTISSSGEPTVNKKLQKCYDYMSREGFRADAIIDWIGYAIGIAWCSKSPKFSEQVEVYLDEHFPWEALIRNPSDYLSRFLAENGASGWLEYYPTPLQVAVTMAMMVDPNWTDSVLEPCIGPGSLILPVKSLNLVGMDLNLLMVKAACIQAFFYKPQLLYSPIPILGVHFHPEEQRVHKYFEFDTDTRIYCGNSLLGEFHAPRHIFEQDSVMEDIYLQPKRERHRAVHMYREELKQEWSTLSKDLRFEIVKAMSREHAFDVVLTNPPFSAKLSSLEKQQLIEIEQDNVAFLAELTKTKTVEMRQLTLF